MSGGNGAAQPEGKVAIVDYSLGNLFSVKHACRHAGLDATITNDKTVVLAADGVLLPGVGAFGDAMATLRKLDLVAALREVVDRGTPVLGICLGQQLLMRESHEFGVHQGLGFFDGEVRRLDRPRAGDRDLKVPHVGWNSVRRPAGAPAGHWQGSPLDGLPDGVCQYFVHSYAARPVDAAAVLAMTRYGHLELCAGVRRGNLFGLQFHPERSGPAGLHIYRNFAALVRRRLATEVSS
jgi:glutamine amidotransferase